MIESYRRISPRIMAGRSRGLTPGPVWDRLSIGPDIADGHGIVDSNMAMIDIDADVLMAADGAGCQGATPPLVAGTRIESRSTQPEA